MSNIKKRVERLERARRRGVPIIIVKQGETPEEALRKHLAEHPEDEQEEGAIIIDCQAPPSGPPPPRPQPPKRPGAASTRTKQITH
jgi:hypothetical protein